MTERFEIDEFDEGQAAASRIAYIKPTGEKLEVGSPVCVKFVE